jgi:hypothetical protein
MQQTNILRQPAVNGTYSMKTVQVILYTVSTVSDRLQFVGQGTGLRSVVRLLGTKFG